MRFKEKLVVYHGLRFSWASANGFYMAVICSGNKLYILDKFYTYNRGGGFNLNASVANTRMCLLSYKLLACSNKLK